MVRKTMIVTYKYLLLFNHLVVSKTHHIFLSIVVMYLLILNFFFIGDYLPLSFSLIDQVRFDFIIYRRIT